MLLSLYSADLPDADDEEDAIGMAWELLYVFFLDNLFFSFNALSFFL